MPKYELSIAPEKVAEAERRISLEGRAFPTLVVHWDSEMLGQTWATTLVLDYTIPLPPLKSGATFNEVRIAAYTDKVPTKFLYFGTELTADAPRVGPDMENTISFAGLYQEYRLSEGTCALPYLSLIQTTPRIYGNGPQDYYSPPITVERFDAGPAGQLIADNFPNVVANLPPTPGDHLTNPAIGFWQGSRFVGTRKIAILSRGEVVGLCFRGGRIDRDQVPPGVQRRDPKLDVRDDWVAIDFGASATVIAIGDEERHEFVRLGATRPPKVSRDYENPSEISVQHLSRVLKAWSDRVILPLTCWGDLYVGQAAAERRLIHGKERALRTRASLGELGTLPARLEAGEEIQICGRSDIDDTLKLEDPAPPIIDEEGVAPDDPFDPVELYAYYVGLHVNTRQRGIHLRYAIGMPTGWPQERRERVVVAFRRGILRSLPAGMVAFDDLEQLQVVDAGPNVLAFASHAFEVFSAIPRPGESIPFVAIDAGASETAVVCGVHRQGGLDETLGAKAKVVEHVAPTVMPQFGGEHLLHRMALRVFSASLSSMKQNSIPFRVPAGEPVPEGMEELVSERAEADVNVRLLKDAVRSILEFSTPQPVPDVVSLFTSDGRVCDVRILVDRAALTEWVRGRLSEAAVEIKDAIVKGIQLVTRNSVGYTELRVFVGGRLGMHPFLAERLKAVLPQGVRIHLYREPDETNLSAPTVRLGAALGMLSIRGQQLATKSNKDVRSSFNYRVGRLKRGKMLVVLDEKTAYDEWHELGACTRPEATVAYIVADEAGEGEIAAADPNLRSVVCNLGYDAVGYRIYMRAVSGTEVEVSVGSPGGRPDEGAPRLIVDMAAGQSRTVVDP